MRVDLRCCELPFSEAAPAAPLRGLASSHSGPSFGLRARDRPMPLVGYRRPSGIMEGDVAHVWKWDGRSTPHSTFAYELEEIERIHILVMMGRGIHQGGAIDSITYTWKVIAENLAAGGHVTRIMEFHEVTQTWLACRAVNKEFFQAAHWVWKEVCRHFVKHHIRRLIFIPTVELDEFEAHMRGEHIAAAKRRAYEQHIAAAERWSYVRVTNE